VAEKKSGKKCVPWWASVNARDAMVVVLCRF